MSSLVTGPKSELLGQPIIYHATTLHGFQNIVKSAGKFAGESNRFAEIQVSCMSCDLHHPATRAATRRHRADTCARALHQVSARFRPHRWPDSSFCARSTPFHSSFSDRQCGSHFRFRSISFRRSQTVETGKDSVAPLRFTNLEAAMFRISARQQYGRASSSRQDLSDRARSFASHRIRRCNPLKFRQNFRVVGTQKFLYLGIFQKPLDVSTGQRQAHHVLGIVRLDSLEVTL